MAYRIPLVLTVVGTLVLCLACAGGTTECEAIVTIHQIDKRSSCSIDAEEGAQGMLEWTCGGGDAKATVGKHTYTGTATGDAVAISVNTEFDFRDGCRWQSAQMISGNISSGSLDLVYTERPKPDQRGCARACEARGSVGVVTLSE